MCSEFEQNLALSRSGDRAAMDRLLTGWRPLLWLQARRLLGAELAARVDPSDVVQETMTQACRDLSQFRGGSEGEWVVWLQRMVAGHAVRQRRHHLADRRNVTCDIPLETTTAMDGEPGPLQRLVELEQAARVASAVAGLPQPMREVIIRRVFHRQPFPRIAEALGRSPGAARVLWTRALRQLRRSLAADSK